MNKFVKFSFLGAMAIPSIFTPIDAMTSEAENYLTSRIEIAENYLKADAELKALNNPDKQKEEEAYIANKKMLLQTTKQRLNSPEFQAGLGALTGVRQFCNDMEAEIQQQEAERIQSANLLNEKIAHLKQPALNYFSILNSHQNLYQFLLGFCAEKKLFYTFVHLASNGAHLNTLYHDYNKILHLAAIGGCPRITQYLLDRHRNEMGNYTCVHIGNRYSKTPLELALDNANEEVAVILLKACGCQECVKVCKTDCYQHLMQIQNVLTNLFICH